MYFFSTTNDGRRCNFAKVSKAENRHRCTFQIQNFTDGRSSTPKRRRPRHIELTSFGEETTTYPIGIIAHRPVLDGREIPADTAAREKHQSRRCQSLRLPCFWENQLTPGNAKEAEESIRHKSVQVRYVRLSFYQLKANRVCKIY